MNLSNTKRIALIGPILFALLATACNSKQTVTPAPAPPPTPPPVAQQQTAGCLPACSDSATIELQVSVKRGAKQTATHKGPSVPVVTPPAEDRYLLFLQQQSKENEAARASEKQSQDALALALTSVAQTNADANKAAQEANHINAEANALKAQNDTLLAGTEQYKAETGRLDQGAQASYLRVRAKNETFETKFNRPLGIIAGVAGAYLNKTEVNIKTNALSEGSKSEANVGPVLATGGTANATASPVVTAKGGDGGKGGAGGAGGEGGKVVGSGNSNSTSKSNSDSDSSSSSKSSSTSKSDSNSQSTSTATNTTKVENNNNTKVDVHNNVAPKKDKPKKCHY